MIKKPLIKTCVLASTLAISSLPVNAAVKKTDFNGDGKADLFLQNAYTGGLSAWLINGTSVLQNISYGTVSPSTGNAPIGIKDFNADGRTDLLWYNGKTGALSAWLLNGGTVLQNVSYGTVNRTGGWVPAGLDDFNGDGKGDVLLFNSNTGGVASWLINGTAVSQIASYGTLNISGGWVPIGTKDANGDGRSDLFFFNTWTGGLSAWLVNGSTVLQNANYGNVNIGGGWTPMGLEDFNADGRGDVLLYNPYTGGIGAWLLNGGTVLQSVSYGNLDITKWSLSALKDVNGDSRADLIFYNRYTGAVSAWLINGGSVLQSVSFGTGDPAAGWIPMGMDDFNGDGKTDLFWYNFYTNATTSWLLNGSGVLQSASYGSVPASSVWQVKIPQ